MMNNSPVLTLDEINRTIITPALALLPAAMDSREARVILLAIQMQEDPHQRRAQLIIVAGKAKRGAARGLWQFEKAGGVAGVINHDASSYWAAKVCEARGVKCTPSAVWRALETDDILAAAFARLLLFTDPYQLPHAANSDGAWRLYRYRLWRPGKPHPAKWPGNHVKATFAVRS